MNNNELLDLLKNDVNKFNQYREDNPDQDIDFTGLNLTNFILLGANFSGVTLRNADLRFANLKYADLRFSDLEYAILDDSNLQYVNAWGANFRFASLLNAKVLKMTVSPDQKDMIMRSFGLIEIPETVADHYFKSGIWESTRKK